MKTILYLDMWITIPAVLEKIGAKERDVEHGLAEPVFEPRVGFFHTILWRKGYGPDGVYERMGAEGAVKGRSRDPVAQSGVESKGP